QHRARAALATIAPDLRTGQAESIAEQFDERPAILDFHTMKSAIYGDSDRRARHAGIDRNGRWRSRRSSRRLRGERWDRRRDDDRGACGFDERTTRELVLAPCQPLGPIDVFAFLHCWFPVAGRGIAAAGNVNAMNSAEGLATATTMYCLPLSMYVMGAPPCGPGIQTRPASFPVALSYAHNQAPRSPFGLVLKPDSPAISRVLVT